VNQTLWIREADEPTWKLARRVAKLKGFSGLSEYITHLLKQNNPPEHRVTAAEDQIDIAKRRMGE
jgi:hypothetical protein